MAAVTDGFTDPQRYRHQVDNQRAPQAEGNRYRQAVFNQLQHRSAAKQAIAKIKTQIVAEHLKVAFVNGFIEAVAVGDFGNHFRIEPTAAAIMAFTDIANAGTRMTGAHTAISCAGQPATVAELHGGDRLIDRTAWRNLHDKKIDGDDGPERRDHQ